MLPKTIIGLRQAAEMADVSHQAISDWIEKHGIGEKVDGEWHIDRARLQEIIDARSLLKIRQK